MSKVTIALGSFLLGALFTPLAGSYTSRIVHLAFAQAVEMPGAEPVVPSLASLNRKIRNGTISGAVQPLDGIDCTQCIILSPVLTYAGGQFNCLECLIAKPQRIELKGAALNTVNLLRALDAFGTRKPRTPYVNPDAPRIQLVDTDKVGQQISLISLER